MAIKLSNALTRPAMIMDNLHVDQLLVRVNRTTGSKIFNAQGTTYGVDAEGTHIYNSSDLTVSEADFTSKLIGFGIANGQAVSVSDAISKFESAKLALGDPDVFTLMAYFEAAVGKVFEIAGKATISGIE